MKKLLLILCTVLFLTSCSSMNLNYETDEQENSEENSSEEIEETDSEDTEAEAVNESSIPEGFSVSFDNAYYTTSGDKNYILVEASFSNNSTETMSFNQVYSVQAFQNGVGLIHTNNWDAGKYDMTAISASLQPNYSTKVYIGFEARSESNDVNIECTPLDGSNKITQTLNMTTISVEPVTEIQTVIVTQQVPAPPAQNYSSTAKYTCQGRTMEQAYNLAKKP